MPKQPTHHLDLYGLAEVADAIDIKPDTLSQWRRRGKMPEPDAALRCGPIWKRRTIEPWIKRQLKER